MDLIRPRQPIMKVANPTLTTREPLSLVLGSRDSSVYERCAAQCMVDLFTLKIFLFGFFHILPARDALL